MQRWEKVETPIICAAKQEKAEKSTSLMCRQDRPEKNWINIK